jgi:hypothetical protein
VVAIIHVNDGTAAATRIAPIVMTTSISINVKPRERIALLPLKKLIQMRKTKPACTAQRVLFRDERTRCVGPASGTPFKSGNG